jgi:hypothetical protein
MPTTTNHPPTTDALRVPVLLPDGSTGEGVLDGAALDAIAARVAGLKAPIVGYVALQAALAKVGIKAGVRTLKDWRARRWLPHRKHNRDVVFYLDEVLERIGGRS